MHEACTWLSNCDVSGSDMNRIGYDFDVSSVISYDSTINDEVVKWIRIHIKQDSPVAIESDIVSKLRNSTIRPLSGITP